MAEEWNYETPEMRLHRLVSPDDQRSDPAFKGKVSDLPAFPPGHDEACPCSISIGSRRDAKPAEDDAKPAEDKEL